MTPHSHGAHFDSIQNISSRKDYLKDKVKRGSAKCNPRNCVYYEYGYVKMKSVKRKGSNRATITVACT